MPHPRAKSLPVPIGTIPSGHADPARPLTALLMVPSPPATTIASCDAAAARTLRSTASAAGGTTRSTANRSPSARATASMVSRS